MPIAYGNYITLDQALALGIIDDAEAVRRRLDGTLEILYPDDLPVEQLGNGVEMADPVNDTNRVTEEQRAQLAKRRGQAAAQIVDPEERRKFISAQGDAEAVNKGDLSVEKHKQLSEETALKGYHKGGRVTETGPARLLKDEHVLSKPEAKKYRATTSLVEAALAHKETEDKQPTKPPKKVKSVHVRRGANKGYIAENHHTHPEHYPMEEHPLANKAALDAHMQEHMGDESEPVDNPAEEAVE